MSAKKLKLALVGCVPQVGWPLFGEFSVFLIRWGFVEYRKQSIAIVSEQNFPKAHVKLTLLTRRFLHRSKSSRAKKQELSKFVCDFRVKNEWKNSH